MTATSGTLGLVINGGVEFVGEKTLFPSGVNKEFGYWRSSKHKSLVSNFDMAHYALEDTAIVDGTAYVYNTFAYPGEKCRDGGCGRLSTVKGGVGEWSAAGELRSRSGDDGIQQRSLYLAKGGHIDAGSGIDLTAGYTVYAKLTPSGDMSGSVLVGQHKKDPASMVLGCDYDARFYVRSDTSVSGGMNVPYYATSTRPFTDYDYPVQLVGVYSSGDASLKIYVNGKEEGVSSPFSREVGNVKSTRVFVGKREYPIDEGKYTGWIDEIGLTNVPMTSSGIKDLYDDRFRLSKWVDSPHAPQGFVTGTSLSSGTITKCGCSGNLPNTMTAEITAITLPEGGSNKGAVGQKVTLTYDAAATYTDGVTTTYTGLWDSGTVSLDCGVGTVRFRLYCGASDQFYMAHSFSWMSDGEDVRTSQACDPVSIVFSTLGGVTSGGGACCSDDAAATISVTVTASTVINTAPSEFVGTGFGTGFAAANSEYIEFVVASSTVMGNKGGSYDKTLWGAKNNIAATATLTFGATEFNVVNNGTIALIDADNVNKTYKIKNDASATASAKEFNSGANRGAAAENLAQIIESANGHNGTIIATDSVRTPFSSGGYDFSDGTVVFVQATMGAVGNTTITTAASFDDCTNVNVGSAFAGGGDRPNVIESQVGVDLGDPPTNFYQLHKFEMDAYVQHTSNHHSGVLLSVGLQKKSQTEKNKGLADVGWQSTRMSIPSGDIRKVTFSGVVPDSLMHLSGGAFRPDLAEHEIRFFLNYPQSTGTYDSEFKIYSTNMRYEGFETVSTDSKELTMATVGTVTTIASGAVDLFLESSPVVRTLPLFIRSRDGKTGLGGTGDSLMTGVGTVGTNDFMNLYILGAIEIATMNLFTKNVTSVHTKIGKSDLFTQGDVAPIFPSKFNDISLFIKDLVSGSGTPNASMNLTMPNVGSAKLDDHRLLFVRGLMPHTVKTTSLYLRVPEQALKTLELRLEGPPYYKPSGVMNLFLQVHQPQFAVKGRIGNKLAGRDTYGLEPAILQNKNMSLVTSGHAPFTSNMNLSIPNVVGSGTKELGLFTSGPSY